MYNKASQTYRLREVCGSGNGEPNNTLNNVSVDQQHLSNENRHPPPVSKEGPQAQESHYGDSAASQRA
jgi:hypothetical protein